MEKNENVMAARAASPPSFSGLSSGFEACHWLVRKQKPTNQRNAQKAGMGHHRHAKGKDKDNKEIRVGITCTYYISLEISTL